ncbi:MAG: IS1634 family transposase, partial [Eubacteriales bacterium]|nr:IS1634 family transposase [Eubacteriales bacterium]
RSIYLGNRKNTSEVVRRFGSRKELLKQDLGGLDPEDWVRAEIAKMNEEEKQGEVFFSLSERKRIPKEEQRNFHIGHFFLAGLYHGLGLEKLSHNISAKHKFKYDLDAILSMLVYARILFPGSKRASVIDSKQLYGITPVEEHQVYRALDVLALHSDEIQAEIYKNSTKLIKRKTSILYYDCTNYFFEISSPRGLRQYGIAKDHKPKPLVQMGLFMDASGVPLAFSIHPGNVNEQTTLQPLEEKILKDFECSKFIVCTDAGLASTANRKYNTKGDRAFVTVQSVKKLKKYLEEWALSPEGWRLPDSEKIYTLYDLDEEKDKDKIFYKERWINENNLEQRLIVSYSLKYKEYKQSVRQGHVERALKAIGRREKGSKRVNPNDFRRFIGNVKYTEEGEVAEHTKLYLNEEQIEKEQMYDGFYAVCTNLEGDAKDIIRINKNRWQVESCFKVLKSEFRSRPVNLQKDDRIHAHFLSCFIALILFRILKLKLNHKGKIFTDEKLTDTLRAMEISYISKQGYVPHYTPDEKTDRLHDFVGFHTDTEIIRTSTLRKYLAQAKKLKFK